MNKLCKNGNIELQNKYIGKFKIKMTSPSTTQDKDRDESFKQKIDSIKQLMDLIGSEDIIKPETKKDIIKYLITNMLNKQEVADMIEKDDFFNIQEEENDPDLNVSDEDIVKIFLEKISALKEKNTELNAKLTELNGEIASHKKLLNNSTKLIERLKNISKYIDTATNEEKKKLISSIIERVYVNGDTGAVNIKFKQPDN